MKQGWGHVPRGHWIIAEAQANAHDENTAVHVYFQMPFSSNKNKDFVLQQVSAPQYLVSFHVRVLFCDFFHRVSSDG
jgi:hypothetical protein